MFILSGRLRILWLQLVTVLSPSWKDKKEDLWLGCVLRSWFLSCQWNQIAISQSLLKVLGGRPESRNESRSFEASISSLYRVYRSWTWKTTLNFDLVLWNLCKLEVLFVEIVINQTRHSWWAFYQCGDRQGRRDVQNGGRICWDSDQTKLMSILSR